MDFNPNPFYQGHTLKDLLDPNLTYWVHHGKHILKQGRTIWWNPNAGMVSIIYSSPNQHFLSSV